MSRAYIAFYPGDYDRDTAALSTLEHGVYFLLLKQCWVHGSIPLDPARRAAIAKLSLRDWRKVAPAIEPFFDAEGRNHRATVEIEKAEQHRIRHAIAGRRGGEKAAITRARKRSLASSGASSGASSLASSEAVPNQNRLINTTSGTARASGSATKPAEKPPIPTTGSLAEVIAAKGWVQP